MNRLAHMPVVQEMSLSDKSKRQEMSPDVPLRFGVAAKFEGLARIAVQHLTTEEMAKLFGKDLRTAQRAAKGDMTYPHAVILKEELLRRGIDASEMPSLDVTANKDASEWASLGERLHRADPELFVAQISALRRLVKAAEDRRRLLEDVSKPLGTED